MRDSGRMQARNVTAPFEGNARSSNHRLRLRRAETLGRDVTLFSALGTDRSATELLHRPKKIRMNTRT